MPGKKALEGILRAGWDGTNNIQNISAAHSYQSLPSASMVCLSYHCFSIPWVSLVLWKSPLCSGEGNSKIENRITMRGEEQKLNGYSWSWVHKSGKQFPEPYHTIMSVCFSNLYGHRICSTHPSWSWDSCRADLRRIILRWICFVWPVCSLSCPFTKSCWSARWPACH